MSIKLSGDLGLDAGDVYRDVSGEIKKLTGLGGAAMVGTSDGRNVQDAVDELNGYADRAEAAADVAQIGANIYANTVDGLSDTTDGDYFNVVSAESTEYMILYRNDSGVATELKRYPSVLAIWNTETVQENFAQMATSIIDTQTIVVEHHGFTD